MNENIVDVQVIRESTPQQATKTCPFCAETILLQAKKCKHCGEFLEAVPSIRDSVDKFAGNPETTEYVRHPPMFRSKPFAFILTLLLCFAGIGFAVLLVWWIRNLGTTLTVTSNRTILTKGILSKSTSEVYHLDVRNIQVKQTALQRLCDVGTIEISSAAQSGFEITVDDIPEPNRVKQIIIESRHI